MRYYLLLTLVSTGAFAVASLAGTAAMIASWRRVARSLPADAAQRARRLAALRLAPFALGLIAFIAVASTFLRFEPRSTTEEPGLLLISSAAVTLVLVGHALRRLAAGLETSRHCQHLLAHCASRRVGPDGHPLWIVDSEYPVAAVFGIVHTRLLLSQRIMSELTAAEIACVVRHEAAHIRRRDNLVQAAMRFLPDPAAHTRTGQTIQIAWRKAAEEAADDLAASGVEQRTDLASALVRVAGMAYGPPPGWMPALTFFERGNVESRVRRLLVGPPDASRSVVSAPVSLALALTAAILMIQQAGPHIHTLMELAVQVLP